MSIRPFAYCARSATVPSFLFFSIDTGPAAKNPVAALREVYRGGPNTVIAGALLPKGAALPVSGGFRLTGRWTFASGCHQADWMLGSSAVMAQGTPRLRPDGRPDVRTFCLPIGACEILDTWHTTGLRGTGSHDWQVTDVFVPEAQSFPLLFDGPSAPQPE